MKRKILGSLVAIGLIATAMGATFATFSSAQGAQSTVTTGTLALTVGSPVTVPLVVSNVQPGYASSRAISLQNTGSLAGDLTVQIVKDSDTEVGACLAPEAALDTSCAAGAAGELGANLRSAVKEGATVLLAANTINALAGAASPVALGAMAPSAARSLTIDIDLPVATGNIVQSDRIVFNAIFTLTQAASNTPVDQHGGLGRDRQPPAGQPPQPALPGPADP